MAVYFALILLFAGALWWFNHKRQARLDADPAQHRLASLLTAAATGQPGANREIAAEQLAQVATGGADRRVRLSHAVMLVRATAAPELYAKVLALARTL